MHHISCPHCGSLQVRCRHAGKSPARRLAPSWAWGRGAALGVSFCALCAVLVNVFMLDAGNITSSMAWTQIGLALLVALLAWLGFWRARANRKSSLHCRCLLCGEQWRGDAS